MPFYPHRPDKILFFTINALIIYGLLILASASVVKSQQVFGESYYYLKHQLLGGVLMGLGLFFLLLRIRYQLFKKLAVFLFLLSLGLIGLTLFPHLGKEFGGARNWLQFGGIIFQPSEFAKLTFVIYLSAWLANRGRVIGDFKKGLLPFLMLNGILGVFLIFQPDIGTLSVICLCSALLFFVAGGRWYQLFLILFFGLLVFMLLVYSSHYRMSRILTFLNPQRDPLGASYQVQQSLIGIGSGGIFGRGYGEGLQKRGFLPEAISDSIFVIVAEELGLVGSFILIFLFLVLAFRGFRIAKRAPDNFGKLLASGITLLIVLQAFINIAAVSGLLPLTGLTLPLVSYGGSSYLATLMGLGVLLNISRYTKEQS